MLRKRLGIWGLVVALTGTSVFGNTGALSRVYAKEETESITAQAVAMDVRDFLSFCDEKTLINVTVTEKQANEMLQVIDEVTKGLEKEYDRAEAIYNWVASNIKYCSDQSVAISSEPYQVFIQKEAVCGGFSNLIKEMMNLAGIPAVALVGYYGSGMPHQWNAVYVENNWVYADGTSQGFFNHESLLSTHYPVEVKDAVIMADSLQLGYYYGLAVVGASGSKVQIPNDYQGYPITGVSHSLFSDRFNVEEIEINANITSIEESTLKSSSKIKDIKVSEGNTSYASHEGALFRADYSTLIVYPYASERTEFTLPKETKYMDIKEAFPSVKLQNIYVESGNEEYSSYEGALYNAQQTQLLCVPAGKTRIRVLDTAEISETAFANVDTSKITIVAKSDSPAVEFAKNNKIAWEEPDGMCTVTFKDGETTISTEIVKKGEKAEVPEAPSKEGYEFTGWYLAGSTTAYDFNTPVIGDMTLTAGWKAVEEEVLPTPVEEYTVIFKDGEITVSSNTVTKGDKVTAPAALDKTGYKFLGWYEGEVKYDFDKVVEKALVLTAKWLELGEIEDNDKEDLGDKEVIEDKVWAAGVEDLTYTGKKLTQNIRVYDGDKKLTEKKDYTVAYKNNQNAYTLERDGKDGKFTDNAPQVIIKMKGDYKGTKVLNFQILPIDLSVSGNGIAADDLYFDSNAKKPSQKLNVTVTWNGKKLGKKDFTVTPGEADITKVTTEPLAITVKGNGNFTGERTVYVTVGEKKTDFAMSKMKVTIDGKAKAKADWTKDGVTFEESRIVVKNGKTVLNVGTDYIIKGYENNDKVGTATLILEGAKGSQYHGQKRVAFQIAGTPMSKTDVTAPVDLKKEGYTYTGKEIALLAQENVKVIKKNEPTTILELGKDFTAVYSKNVDKGTASVVLTGCPEAGYTGTKKITYKIAQENVNKLDIRMESDQVEIVKGGAKAAFSVSHNGIQLTEGKDYTVTYKNNKAVTEEGAKAQAVIKGKGNYTGTTEELTFTVTKKSISSNDITVVVKDKEAVKNGKWKQSFKVYDVDGKALTAKKDYRKEAVYEKAVKDDKGNVVSYEALTGSEKLTESCDIRITITGEGMYTETTYVTYQLLAANHDVSKASIQVNDQYYNGGEVTLQAEKDFFKKAEIKGVQLFNKDESANFEIVEDSYQKNDKKGTAKVTIKGIGDFGGEKTITFKIKERNVEDNNNWWEDLMKNLFR